MPESIKPPKEYIGDGVYASYDGYHLVLTTEDGISAYNTICIEPEVWRALDRYVVIHLPSWLRGNQ